MIWIGRGVVLVVVLVCGLTLPTLFFDDAYITFRYADRLADGEGFTYNPGERVLGVTTPLFTLLLAAAAWLGIDIESAALLLGWMGHALLCLIVYEAVPLLVPESVSNEDGSLFRGRLLAALACAVHPHLALTAVRGMETSLFCAAAAGTLLLSARGQWIAGGAALGLAGLARPDAILLALPAGWLVTKVRETGKVLRFWGLAGVSILVVSPWVYFSWSYFGSFVPQSILAKRLIHPATPRDVLVSFWMFLIEDWFMVIFVPLALLGLWVGRRKPLAVALFSYVALYLTALALGGVMTFPWYANPVVFPPLMLGAAGLVWLLPKLPRGGPALGWALTLLITVTGFIQIFTVVDEVQEEWEEWEGAYEIAARWVMNDSNPGDRVYVGEVGVTGYLLPGRVIIDSSGINSPAVYERRLGLEETNPAWSRKVIGDLAPKYIVTSVQFLNIGMLAREQWFTFLYEKVPLPLLEGEGHVVYKRRDAR